MTADDRESDTPPGLPRSIGVIGGGTAGFFTALAVKRRFPHIAVTVLESSAVPIIGVGEATTTLMPPFLHAQLGLPALELYRAVKPTFKLGIKFEWGLPGDYYFTYPFGDSDPVEAFAFDGDLRAQSLVSLLMADDRGPVLRGPDGELLSLLPKLKFAYHLDNAPFVAFLAAAAELAGIERVELTVDAVVPRADGTGIAALRDKDGREVAYDFYVDATGFRSELLEKSLGSPYLSYASSLFCDRAIVATVPQPGPIRPYTTAETMNAGWCWRIPVDGTDHRGYVYSSAHMDEDVALAEMRARNPGMGEPWVVRFRSGRHRDFWVGNTVGMGNAYGFVEPLESTALHMVIIQIAYLLAGLEAAGDPHDYEVYRAFANEAVGGHWDYLRWFLAAHYKFNNRLDTPFWRAARADVDVTGVEDVIQRFQREGPWLAADGKYFEVGDPAFGFSGLMVLLLGQKVDAPVRPRASVTREEWEERVAKQRRLVARALPHRDALQALVDDPVMLDRFTSSPSSWCCGDAERVHVLPRGSRAVHPQGGMPSTGDADEHLLRSVR